MAFAPTWTPGFNRGRSWPLKARSQRCLVKINCAIKFGTTAGTDERATVQVSAGNVMDFELGRGLPAPLKNAETTHADNEVPVYFHRTAGAAADKVINVTFNSTWGPLVWYQIAGPDDALPNTIGWNFKQQLDNPALDSIWRHESGFDGSTGVGGGGFKSGTDATKYVPSGTQLQFLPYLLKNGAQESGATALQSKAFWCSFIFDNTSLDSF